ncbi:YceI family protein [Edaphobacter modestus]|uniref:Polyisoprenoid-binding protein YceI n=1 Tax=Edaphobacter modestus TaxID=388466 RepID=A0A4Q7Z032_9BACT|nr:YceI family protein [Edaphobacter modestus]RZU43490.1 polyisoprenoid-binding protein YceI [Edaphobacter modestus]
MRNRFLAAIVLATASLACTGAQAQISTWSIDPAHSSINFEIRHLGVSNVHGSINSVKGTVVYDEKDIAKSSVQSTADTATVSTNNEKRDTHLKSPDFFDVAKYPQITFKSTSLSNATGKLTLTGDLTLTGVTKTVTLDVDGPAPPQTDNKGKTRSGFSASGKLKRSDFNFGPKFGGATIGDDVKFSIDVEIDKE